MTLNIEEAIKKTVLMQWENRYFLKKVKGGKFNMAKLREEAMAYEPPQTLNIADLEKVPVDVEVFEGSGTKTNSEGKDETFTYKYCEFNQKQYRIPNSVLEELKKILKLKPDVNYVKVSKSGSGMGTRYSVDVAE